MQPTQILVPTDFSPGADAALARATVLARAFGSELHLLHVTVLFGGEVHFPEHLSQDLESLQASLDEHAAEQLETRSKLPSSRELKVKHARRRAIAPAPEIEAYAEEHGIDLIVIGTHGRRGLRRLLLGSVAEEVLRSAPCPVMTVKASGESGDEAGDPSEANPSRRLVVPFDFSDQSEAGLQRAIELAKTFDGSIDVVHVVAPPIPPGGMAGIPLPGPGFGELLPAVTKTLRARVDRIVEGLDSALPPIECHVLEGPTAETLVDHANGTEADLIVVGGHGLNGLSRFLLGSVSEKVVRAADCPVLVLRDAAATAKPGDGVDDAASQRAETADRAAR